MQGQIFLFILRQTKDKVACMDGHKFSYELSPTLFNIYMKEIIVKWKTHLYKRCYFINRNKKVFFLQTIKS